MAKKNEIVKATGNNIAVLDDRPEWLKEDSFRGSEEVTANDIILPRVDVMQALSPQLKKSDPKYIEGAEQGVIFNTVTGELYDTAVNFVPIKFMREFIVWQDRESGGGFKGAFPTEAEAEAERRNLENPDAHEVVETHVHFVLLVHGDGRIEEAVLSLAKSKRKVSRKLNSLVQMFPGDRFGRVYKLVSIEVDGPKGEYWSFDVQPVGWAPRDLYDRGLHTYEAINRGERGVDRAGDADAEGSATV